MILCSRLWTFQCWSSLSKD